MSFIEFAKLFLQLSAINNKPSEVEEKESILRVHLVPFFGALALAAIGFAEVQNYVALKLTRLARKTVNNHLAVLRRLLVVSYKRGVIERVPEIEWLRVPPPAYDFLSFDEAAQLVADSIGMWRRMITVAIQTGLRLGELLALAPGDINLEAGSLEVRRSITRGYVTTPKNGRHRTVALSDYARAALAEQMAEAPGAIVFAAHDGGYLTASMARHALERECRRAGVRRVSWHVFRHTCASHLVMLGVPLRAVQQLLGHSTLTMTERYAHLAPSFTRDAVLLLDHVLSPARRARVAVPIPRAAHPARHRSRCRSSRRFAA